MKGKNMSGNFQIGDVVLLKSGGEAMTVEGYEDGANPPIVKCVWSDKGKVQRGNFIEATLEKPNYDMGFSV